MIPCSSEIILRLETSTYWNDKRLSLGNCSGLLNQTVVDRIWLPRPYVHHTSFIEPVNQINSPTESFEATPDGDEGQSGFYWYMEMVYGLHCKFDFTYYPFDTQFCDVKLHSKDFSVEFVNYKTWGFEDKSQEIQQTLKYDIEFKVMTDQEDLVFNNYYDYSTCGFVIKLKRKLGSSMINIFIPSFLIVLVAFTRYSSVSITCTL